MPVRRDGHPVREGLRRDVRSGGLDNDAFPDVLPGGPDGERAAVRLAGFVPPPLDPCLLHLEKVREVRLNPQGDDAFGRLQREVADGDLLLDAGAHFPQPLHDQRAVRVAVGAGNPADKERPVRRLRLGGQRLKRLAINRQSPARQNPGIAHEETMRMIGTDVSVGH